MLQALMSREHLAPRAALRTGIRPWQRCSTCYTPPPANPTRRRGTVTKTRLTPAYTTRLGKAYRGDALDVLRQLPDASVSLAFTSPPFALRRQKAYGNV